MPKAHTGGFKCIIWTLATRLARKLAQLLCGLFIDWALEFFLSIPLQMNKHTAMTTQRNLEI